MEEPAGREVERERDRGRKKYHEQGGEASTEAFPSSSSKKK